MLETALKYTTTCLNQHLKNQFGLEEDKAVTNTVVDQDGSIPTGNRNKLVLSMINIEEEKNRQFYQRKEMLSNHTYTNGPRTHRYNLHLMLSAGFDDYYEALKFLNSGIRFFQLNELLDNNRYGDMPETLEKLEFEMEQISYHEMYNLWSSIGAKYQPSVIYKMRLITILSDETDGFIPAVTGSSEKVLPQ